MVTSISLTSLPSSESSSSSTSSLKRPLSNKPAENNKIKKIRLTEKNHIEEQLGVSISSTTNPNKEDDTNLLATKIDQVTQSEKNNDSQITNISSENLMEGSENDATLNYRNDSNCDNSFYDKNIVKSPRMNSSILATVLENNKNNILNKSDPVLSQIAQNSLAKSVNSDNNKHVNENNFVSNRSSSLSSKKLASLENSDNKDNDIDSHLVTADDQTPIKNNSSNFNPTMSETTSVQQTESINNIKKSMEPQNSTKMDANIADANVNNTKEVSDNDDDDVMEVFDSDSNDDPYNESEFIESVVVDEILEGIKKILTDSNFTHLMRLFNKKNIPFEVRQILA